ncbi:diguanylate cyclase [Deinococcus sp. SDU3-2]|uniref:Diguanylate cyclase n=1 Tax=Deinococcus terrestris TaxID=2651870 RepID=A0A7X1TSY7_9DEIO|nr:GGDEF domain-containing protein [Deinococcus terrestris]MPY67872.1 diguanylate cyclase [Deinococcus terrestris]
MEPSPALLPALPDAPAPLRAALEEAQDDHARAAALLALARHYREHTLHTARRLAQASLDTALPLNDAAVIVDTLAVLASIEESQGLHEAAFDHLALALDLARTHGLDDLRSRVHNVRAIVRLTAGDMTGARRDFLEAQELARASGDQLDLANIHVNLAFLEHLAGRAPEALHQLNLLEELLSTAAPDVRQLMAPYLHENRAATYLGLARRAHARGRTDAGAEARGRAWAALAATWAALEQAPSRIMALIVEAHTARLSVLEGYLDRALAHAQAAMRHHHEAGQRSYLDALLAMAEVQAAREQLSAAHRYYREALVIAREQGRHRDIQFLLRAIAELHERSGDLGSALATTREALAEADATLERLAAIEESHDHLFRELRQARAQARDWQESVRRAEEQARHDVLTGLLNRRGLHDRLLTLPEGSGPLLVVLMDIDDFKGVNDRHSHAVGDEALRAVAERLEDTAPPGSLLVRWGGEEFLLLLPDADPAQAYTSVEHLRRAVADHDWPTLPHGLRLTVSAGYAFAPSPAEMDVYAATEQADEFQYQAKRAGRNRVCPAPPVPA